ncbi:MAG: hypothetical protein ACYDEX_15920 [Mobilitalea sp.]
MNDFINQISIYILLFLPQIAIVFIAFGIGIGICILTIKTEHGNLYQYYTKPVRDNDSKRNKFDELSGTVSIIYREGMIISLIFLFSIAVYDIPDINFQKSYTAFSNISSSLPQELLNWLAIIITLVAMLVAFRKDYYLVFSVPDVLEQYKFKGKTLFVLNMMVIVTFFNLAKNLNVSQTYITGFKMVIIVSYIRALVLSVYLIFRVMDILYTQDKIELRLLDKMYFKVRNKLLISPACYNENIAGTLINCNYLCERHMEEYSKTDKSCLRNIQLQSVHKEALGAVYKNVVKLIARKVNKYLLIITSLYILFFIILVTAKTIYYFDILIMLLISWGSWGILFIIIRSIQNSEFKKIKQILNRMFYSDYVYISENSKGKNIITSIFGFGISNENAGYLKSILNIAIYWKITLSGDSKKNIDAFKAGLRENRAYYAEDQKEFNEIILPLCYFIEYISLTGDKTSFWNELNNETWLVNMNNKQNRLLLEEISFYICALGNRNNISQALGEYFTGIKKVCTECK